MDKPVTHEPEDADSNGLNAAVNPHFIISEYIERAMGQENMTTWKMALLEDVFLRARASWHLDQLVVNAKLNYAPPRKIGSS